MADSGKLSSYFHFREPFLLTQKTLLQKVHMYIILTLWLTADPEKSGKKLLVKKAISIFTLQYRHDTPSWHGIMFLRPPSPSGLWVLFSSKPFPVYFSLNFTHKRVCCPAALLARTIAKNTQFTLCWYLVECLTVCIYVSYFFFKIGQFQILILEYKYIASCKTRIQ